MKLNKMDKLEIGISIAGMILGLIAIIITKNITWIVTTIVWFNLVLEKYCNKKLNNTHKLYEETLERFIKTQKEKISLLEERISLMETEDKCK